MLLRYPYVLRSPEGAGGGSDEPAKVVPALVPVASQAPATQQVPNAVGGTAPAQVSLGTPDPASAAVDTKPAADATTLGSQPGDQPPTDLAPDPLKPVIGEKTFDLTNPQDALAYATALAESRVSEIQTQVSAREEEQNRQTAQQQFDRSLAEFRASDPGYKTMMAGKAEYEADIAAGGEHAEILDKLFGDTPEAKRITEALDMYHAVQFQQTQIVENATVQSGSMILDWAKTSGVPIEEVFNTDPSKVRPEAFKFRALLQSQGLIQDHPDRKRSYFTDPDKAKALWEKHFPAKGVVAIAPLPTNPLATSAPAASASASAPAVSDEDRNIALRGGFGSMPPDKATAVVQLFATEEFNKINGIGTPNGVRMAPTKYNDPLLHQAITTELQLLQKQRSRA